MKTPMILTFLHHFPKFAPLPLPNFGKILNLNNYPPLNRLVKLYYAKFNVSNLFFSNVMEENLCKGRVKDHTQHYVTFQV